jgi:catechol 2,3-dioxygenase-like lactoylglutathione lyase family enzyme
MRMKAMTAVCLALVLLAFPHRAGGETYPYDHMHLAAPDPAKAVAWYIANLGAKPGDSPDRVVIGRTIFAFAKSEKALPSVGGVIDHVGFSVPDVDATMTSLVAAGATLLTAARDVPGLFKFGFVQDPFGIKLEIVQDAETPGFHHIHLIAADPDASLAWYATHFGGERQKLKGRIDGLKYTNPNVWLIVQKGEAAPSLGRAIDHLGWAVPNVATTIAALAAAGAKPTEPRAVRHLTVAFVDGPGGVRVEMVQGRKEEELNGSSTTPAQR